MSIKEAKRGAAAHGEKTKVTGVRIPASLLERIETIAQNEKVSKTAVIIHLITVGLAEAQCAKER